MDKRVIIAVATLSLLITIIVSLPQASAAGYNACGVDFRNDNTGLGGVEICGIGYPCGVSDGVCPQNYTQGQNETSKDYYRQPFIRYQTPEGRNVTDTATDQVIPYDDGDEACARIGGTCSGVLRGNHKTGTFNPAPSVGCSSTSGYDESAYYRADCAGVPKVAGCENCPDPDCQTNVSGYVADENNESVGNATVTLSNTNNPGLNQNSEIDMFGKTNSSGGFNLPESVSGYMNVTCTAKRYNEQQFETYVQPGQDTVTCPDLGAAACTTNCTAPDAFGNEVCVAQCDGENGCSMNQTYQRICGGLPPDTERFRKRINETHIQVAQCCTGPFETRYAPLAQIEENSTSIESLEVTDYTRELNGTPVTVKVVRYTD